VWSTDLENEEAKARYRAVKIQPQWVITPGTKKKNLRKEIASSIYDSTYS
jgi:hypothetical protein